MKHLRFTSVLAALSWISSACVSHPPYDYGHYVELMPRSIIVLPPLDETPEVDACYGYLATVTQPLAELGYYVFPVAIVDRMLRENGLPSAGEMHQVPLQKLKEVFGADAVLFLDVKQWGSSYEVFASVTRVEVEARLVDLNSGTELWSGTKSAESSASGGGGLLEMAVSAAIDQVANSMSDPSPSVARQTNADLFADPNNGLLPGPRHPKHEERLKALRSQPSTTQAPTGATQGSDADV